MSCFISKLQHGEISAKNNPNTRAIDRYFACWPDLQRSEQLILKSFKHTQRVEPGNQISRIHSHADIPKPHDVNTLTS
jgi:hypothetical protein